MPGLKGAAAFVRGRLPSAAACAAGMGASIAEIAPAFRVAPAPLAVPFSGAMLEDTPRPLLFVIGPFASPVYL